MKTTAATLFLALIIGIFSTGCTDSTGQVSDRVEQESNDTRDVVQSQRSSRSDRDEDGWDEHRKNFGERRSSTDSYADSYDARTDDDTYDSWGDEDHDDSWADDQKKNRDHDFHFDFEELVDGETEQELEEALSQVGEALEEIGEAFSEGSNVKSVDYDELKSVLPSRVRGLEMKDYSGDNVRVFGINLSVYEQRYKSNSGDERLEITLIDMGSLANAALVGMDWLDVKIESESSSGFERTTTVDNYPAFEQCEKSSWAEQCSLHVMVENRFVVEIEGEGMTIDKIRDVFSEMDIRKLKNLSDQGI